MLRGAEHAARALQPLVDANVIGGFDSPANYLPSAATQEARRAACRTRRSCAPICGKPPPGLDSRSDRLQPFSSDVEAARHAPLVTAHDLQGTSLRAGFDALILHQKDHWNALLPLHAAAAGADDRPAPGGGGAATRAARARRRCSISSRSPTRCTPATWPRPFISRWRAFWRSTVLLLIALRSPLRVARVLAPLVLAVLTVAAGLALCGVQLTILHLVGMLLIVAVGSNYALFFDRQANSHEAGSEALTLASLVIANASTVIGFGLLSFSQVPVLVALGTTVAPGAFLALLFAAIGARHPRAQHA